MNLTTPSYALALITSTDQVEYLRSQNRARISNLVNGAPPVDGSTAKKIGLDVVFNDMTAQTIFRMACLQYFNAFQTRPVFFNVRIPSAPTEQRQQMEMFITEFINKPLKESAAFASLLDQKFSSVVMHGIGPQFWMSKDKWCGDFVGLDDIRVPTDTHTNLDNLIWIGRRVRYTITELAKRVYGKYADKGWDKAAIGKILDAYWNQNYNTTSDVQYPNWPERYSQLIRQNGIYFQSDAVPTINLWHIYHLDDENPLNPKIYMKVIPDQTVEGKSYEKFLFNSDKPISDKWSDVMHVQFGDLNASAPFMWHSVRSLGFMLHDSAFWSNITTCRSVQHLWENFQLLIQVDGPGDKMRAAKLEMMKGVLPSGVNIVPQTHRHQIDGNMLNFVLSNLRQKIGESSTAYTQDIDTGTSREQTAFETMTKLQQVNAVLGGLLNMAFRNETHHYREICRRFCKKTSIDPDVRAFRKKCERVGIPPQFLDHNLWMIEPEIPLGQGNQTLELAAATQLMSVRGALGPEGQEISLNRFVAAVTHDVRLAQRIAPVGQTQPVTDGQQFGQLVFGSLMAGGDVPLNDRYALTEQADVLLKMAFDVTSRIESMGNMADAQELSGLVNVMTYVQEIVARLEQDEAQQEAVRAYADAIGQLQNLLKGYAQRLGEQQSQQSNPEAMAKAQEIARMGELKRSEKAMDSEQKRTLKQADWEVKMNQKIEEHNLSMQKMVADARAELIARGAEAAQDLNIKKAQSESQPAKKD